MTLLDTDILLLFFAGHRRVIDRHRRADEEAAITSITRIEILQG